MISSIFRNTSESESEVAQSCLTLCDPKDYSLLGSSVHGIFQAWLLEWIVISFSIRNHVLKPRTGIISSKEYKQRQVNECQCIEVSLSIRTIEEKLKAASFYSKKQKQKQKQKKKKSLTSVWPLVCVIILDVQRQITARNQ